MNANRSGSRAARCSALRTDWSSISLWRKKIGKGEGDWVHVILYADNSPIVIPEEFLVCLLDAPKAHTFFKTLTESAQKHYIDWIYEAKRLETKVNRISKTIERLEKGLKMYDVDESE